MPRALPPPGIPKRVQLEDEAAGLTLQPAPRNTSSSLIAFKLTIEGDLGESMEPVGGRLARSVMVWCRTGSGSSESRSGNYKLVFENASVRVLRIAYAQANQNELEARRRTIHSPGRGARIEEHGRQAVRPLPRSHQISKESLIAHR
jgi:hypothetical protein